MPNKITAGERPDSVRKSTGDIPKQKMKLFLYLFLINHYMDIKKQDVQIFCLWNVTGACCLMVISHNSRHDMHLTSWSHLHGTNIAEVTECAVCGAWSRTCKESSVSWCVQNTASHLLRKGLRRDVPSLSCVYHRHRWEQQERQEGQNFHSHRCYIFKCS